MQSADYPEIDASFGHWLAGLIDGEGCFSIRARREQRTFVCFLEVRLRDDDRPLLEMCQTNTGMGRLYSRPTGDGNDNPTVCWTVFRQRDSRRLVEVFDRHPLRSKKARDYGIWRDAVMTLATIRRGNWAIRTVNQPAWDRLEVLKERLSAGRAYQPCELPELPEQVLLQEALWG